MKLIDADAWKAELKKFIERITRGNGPQMSVGTAMAIIKMIDSRPEADAVPTVHAQWVRIYPDERYRACSNCGWEHPDIDHMGWRVADRYCPACGAKMDDGVNEQ